MGTPFASALAQPWVTPSAARGAQILFSPALLDFSDYSTKLCSDCCGFGNTSVATNLLSTTAPGNRHSSSSCLFPPPSAAHAHSGVTLPLRHHLIFYFFGPAPIPCISPLHSGLPLPLQNLDAFNFLGPAFAPCATFHSFGPAFTPCAAFRFFGLAATICDSSLSFSPASTP